MAMYKTHHIQQVVCTWTTREVPQRNRQVLHVGEGEVCAGGSEFPLDVDGIWLVDAVQSRRRDCQRAWVASRINTKSAARENGKKGGDVHCEADVKERGGKRDLWRYCK